MYQKTICLICSRLSTQTTPVHQILLQVVFVSKGNYITKKMYTIFRGISWSTSLTIYLDKKNLFFLFLSSKSNTPRRTKFPQTANSNLITHVDDDIRIAGTSIANCKINASFNSKLEKTQNIIIVHWNTTLSSPREEIVYKLLLQTNLKIVFYY